MKPTNRSAREANSLQAFLVCSLLTALFLVTPIADNRAGPPSEKGGAEARKKEPERGAMEVRFADGRKSKVIVANERLELITPFGKLLIPVASIHRIRFASQISKEMIQRVDAAIADLASDEFQRREDASAQLLKLREKAYPALLNAAQNKDPEVARRAEVVLKGLRQAVAEEDLEFRKYDVVYTEDSKIAGRIEGIELKVVGGPPEKTRLNREDIRGLRSLAVEADEDLTAAVDPGDLKAFEAQVGKTFMFKVTGAVTAPIWGTDVYTTDSALATVAVHAGVLKAGQTGVVRVKIVAPLQQFAGSNKNGVTSSPWGAYPGAYQVSR